MTGSIIENIRQSAGKKYEYNRNSVFLKSVFFLSLCTRPIPPKQLEVFFFFFRLQKILVLLSPP